MCLWSADDDSDNSTWRFAVISFNRKRDEWLCKSGSTHAHALEMFTFCVNMQHLSALILATSLPSIVNRVRNNGESSVQLPRATTLKSFLRDIRELDHLKFAMTEPSLLF